MIYMFYEMQMKYIGQIIGQQLFKIFGNYNEKNIGIKGGKFNFIIIFIILFLLMKEV